jgi:hypothetical protein
MCKCSCRFGCCWPSGSGGGVGGGCEGCASTDGICDGSASDLDVDGAFGISRRSNLGGSEADKGVAGVGLQNWGPGHDADIEGLMKSARLCGFNTPPFQATSLGECSAGVDANMRPYRTCGGR